MRFRIQWLADLNCTVAHNCHVKYKLLTSNTNYSHQIQIAHIKYKILTSKTRLNGQRSENENYVQFSLGLDPTAILFLHVVLSERLNDKVQVCAFCGGEPPHMKNLIVAWKTLNKYIR